MTQPNQSELDELYLQQTLLKLIGVKDGDPRYSDVLLIADYITANYTPNSEVAERERVARVAESKLWYDEWGNGTEQIGDGSWEYFYDYRIAELTKAKEQA